MGLDMAMAMAMDLGMFMGVHALQERLVPASDAENAPHDMDGAVGWRPLGFWPNWPISLGWDGKGPLRVWLHTS